MKENLMILLLDIKCFPLLAFAHGILPAVNVK
jgi:hypothetical protein